MNNFWPEGLKLEDTRSPLEILTEATAEWELQSGGTMTLIGTQTGNSKGDVFIIVHAKHLPSSRTAQLFSIVHRPPNHYPVLLQVKDEEVPDYLKKSRWQEGLPSISELWSISTESGRQVHNEWVADTPGEFREKLKKAFNRGVVKGTILNLACTPPVAHESNKEASSPQPDANEAGDGKVT